MIEAVSGIISKFLALSQEIYNYIFGDVQFSVLWSWMPQDIQTAAASFIAILFAIALIQGIRRFLPF